MRLKAPLVIAAALNFSLACGAQESQSTFFVDSRLKTSFSVYYPVDFGCPLPQSFEDLKGCFSNLDSLENLVMSMTKRSDEFFEKEPDPYLEEPPEFYWVSEFLWSNGMVKGCDTIPPSMFCNLFPDGGTLMIYSKFLELRHD